MNIINICNTYSRPFFTKYQFHHNLYVDRTGTATEFATHYLLTNRCRVLQSSQSDCSICNRLPVLFHQGNVQIIILYMQYYTIIYYIIIYYIILYITLQFSLHYICICISPAKAMQTWLSNRHIFLTVLGSCSLGTAFLSTARTTRSLPRTPTYVKNFSNLK